MIPLSTPSVHRPIGVSPQVYKVCQSESHLSMQSATMIGITQLTCTKSATEWYYTQLVCTKSATLNVLTQLVCTKSVTECNHTACLYKVCHSMEAQSYQ